MIEKAQEKHLDRIMEIWLHSNIAAHPFIPRSFWEAAFSEVKEAMGMSDIFVYQENADVMGFIGIYR